RAAVRPGDAAGARGARAPGPATGPDDGPRVAAGCVRPEPPRRRGGARGRGRMPRAPAPCPAFPAPPRRDLRNEKRFHFRTPRWGTAGRLACFGSLVVSPGRAV